MSVVLFLKRRWEWLCVGLVAVAHHLLTYLAYDWYPGTDAYSYDVCGLQLVTGIEFDRFALMFREPLVPVAKNLLYLAFEGKPFILAALVHLLGICAALAAWRLGRRFSRPVGLALGLAVAGYLPLSVHFHQLSVTTFFIPLLILAADRFAAWLLEPSGRRLALVIAAVMLAVLAKSEALLCIPVFGLCALAGGAGGRSTGIFVLSCALAYAAACLPNFLRLGCPGLTCKTGWVLFERTYRPVDRVFDRTNGPASERVARYLDDPRSRAIGEFDRRSAQMSAFNFAQKELGERRADDLFRQASLEAIRRHPGKFAGFTLLRCLGQLGLIDAAGLREKESAYETPSMHLWGFGSERMRLQRQHCAACLVQTADRVRPLEWERRVLAARFGRLIGREAMLPAVPAQFALTQNFVFLDSGEVRPLYCGDGNMSERFWNSQALDLYFACTYWGHRPWNDRALSALRAWDRFMPSGMARLIAQWACWLLWAAGMLLRAERRRTACLLGLFCFTLLFALCQSVFSDNFGGRFALYTQVYVWLGGFCGLQTLLLRAKRSVIR